MANLLKNNLLISQVEQSWLGHLPNHFSFEIALSGGIDSVVLLDIMSQLKQKYNFNLSAVHIHHGLQAEADQWVDFCQQLCHKYQIPLNVEYVVVDVNSSLGIEAEARKQRYYVFEKSLKPVVLLAHHQDDQIETFLLALLRGGGIRGMVSMPVLRQQASVLIWRPLLAITRSEIEHYALAHSLEFIQDPSNQDKQYLRNWVRYELLPSLRNKIGFLDKQLIQNIFSLQNALEIIDALIDKDYQQVTHQIYIKLNAFKKLSLSRQKEVLRFFLKKQELGIPRKNSIFEFVEWINKQSGNFYEWQVPNGNIYAYNGKIWAWSKYNPLKIKIESIGFLKSDIIWQEKHQGVGQAFFQNNWFLRPVNKNDIIQTKIGVQSVFNLLKKNKIPEFIRKSWPVIVNSNDECMIIVGLRIDVRYLQNKGLAPYIPELEMFIR